MGESAETSPVEARDAMSPVLQPPFWPEPSCAHLFLVEGPGGMLVWRWGSAVKESLEHTTWFHPLFHQRGRQGLERK